MFGVGNLSSVYLKGGDRGEEESDTSAKSLSNETALLSRVTRTSYLHSKELHLSQRNRTWHIAREDQCAKSSSGYAHQPRGLLHDDSVESWSLTRPHCCCAALGGSS